MPAGAQLMILIPVTILMSSPWLRLLDPSDKLELAELNGCSEGHGDGGAPERKYVVAPHPIPDRLRGLYLGGPRNGTNLMYEEIKPIKIKTKTKKKVKNVTKNKTLYELN